MKWSYNMKAWSFEVFKFEDLRLWRSQALKIQSSEDLKLRGLKSQSICSLKVPSIVPDLHLTTQPNLNESHIIGSIRETSIRFTTNERVTLHKSWITPKYLKRFFFIICLQFFHLKNSFINHDKVIIHNIKQQKAWTEWARMRTHLLWRQDWRDSTVLRNSLFVKQCISKHSHIELLHYHWNGTYCWRLISNTATSLNSNSIVVRVLHRVIVALTCVMFTQSIQFNSFIHLFIH